MAVLSLAFSSLLVVLSWAGLKKLVATRVILLLIFPLTLTCSGVEVSVANLRTTSATLTAEWIDLSTATLNIQAGQVVDLPDVKKLTEGTTDHVTGGETAERKRVVLVLSGTTSAHAKEVGISRDDAAAVAVQMLCALFGGLVFLGFTRHFLVFGERVRKS